MRLVLWPCMRGRYTHSRLECRPAVSQVLRQQSGKHTPFLQSGRADRRTFRHGFVRVLLCISFADWLSVTTCGGVSAHSYWILDAAGLTVRWELIHGGGHVGMVRCAQFLSGETLARRTATASLNQVLTKASEIKNQSSLRAGGGLKAKVVENIAQLVLTT